LRKAWKPTFLFFDALVAETRRALLDDGATVVLNPGDTYIQNGTRHRWSNRGEVPAVLAVALIGANHTKVGLKAVPRPPTRDLGRSERLAS
jgi:hypothetical protein